MKEQQIHKGIWFTPEHEEKKYGGTLSISKDNKIFLELLSIDTNNNHLFDFSPSIILGYNIKDEKITLVEPTITKGQQSVKGVINWRINFKYCIVGKHFNSKEELVFSRIHLDINTFSEWVRSEHYKRNRRKIFTDKELFKNDSLSINLWINDREDIISIKPPKKIIETKGYLVLAFSSKINLQEIIRTCKHLNSLVCIGTNQACFINQASYLDETGEYPVRVKLIIDDLQFSLEKKISPNEFLFYFNYISDEIETILQFWISNQKKLQPIVELLLNSYYSNMINDWGLFMNLISGLESFHREFIRSDDEDSKAKFQKIIDLIEQPELNKWLKNKKIIFKSVSLPNRIVEICKDESLNLVNIDKINKFKRVVADTRNMFAHNLPRHSKIADEFEIHLINGILKNLLEFHILKKAGIDKEKLKNKFEKKRDYKSILNMKRINNFEKY